MTQVRLKGLRCYFINHLCTKGWVRYCAQCGHWFCEHHWGEGSPARCIACRRFNAVATYLYPPEDACESCGGVGHHYRTCWRSGGSTISPCTICKGSGVAPDMCFYADYVDPDSPCNGEKRLCTECGFWYCTSHWGGRE